jgi:hypothetical protein
LTAQPVAKRMRVMREHAKDGWRRAINAPERSIVDRPYFFEGASEAMLRGIDRVRQMAYRLPELAQDVAAAEAAAAAGSGGGGGSGGDSGGGGGGAAAAARQGNVG